MLPMTNLWRVGQTPTPNKRTKASSTQASSGKSKVHDYKRKANASKQKLILNITKSLGEIVEQLEIVNCEREVTFVYKDVKYKLVLSCPRK